MSATKIRVVLADDERPARSFSGRVAALLDDVEVVAQARRRGSHSANQAAPAGSRFLDLQMPEVDGLASSAC